MTQSNLELDVRETGFATLGVMLNTFQRQHTHDAPIAIPPRDLLIYLYHHRN